MAHIGIYQTASARNTHFNDDNHLQNDAYPFYFFFLQDLQNYSKMWSWQISRLHRRCYRSLLALNIRICKNYGSTAVFALLLFSIKRKWFLLFSHSLLFPIVFWVDVFSTWRHWDLLMASRVLPKIKTTF